MAFVTTSEMPLTPILELVRNTSSAGELAQILDEIMYEYAVDHLDGTTNLRNDSGTKYYMLRELRDAFKKMSC